MASVYDGLGDIPASTSPTEAVTPRGKKRPEGLTPSQVRAGQSRMLDMVEQAFATLHQAMDHADFPTAVKAAQIILDRTGFGPKSTVDFNSTHMDLSTMNREQLHEFAKLMAARTAVEPRVIDVTPLPRTP